jgi:hypothetical protein
MYGLLAKAIDAVLEMPRHGANGCGSLAGDSPSVLNNTAQR